MGQTLGGGHPVEDRHPDVHHHDVGAVLTGERERPLTVLGLCDYRDGRGGSEDQG
ncbi:hypothetical protein KCMC57_up62910 [Kitasatospora sp. CMC57]|uniref:Uncharacterized protein n=1 Tax=Kitasatospora sp. CMC57 TaxID=3231513 RepID=A0AB33K2W7_9ACTN